MAIRFGELPVKADLASVPAFKEIADELLKFVFSKNNKGIKLTNISTTEMSYFHQKDNPYLIVHILHFKRKYQYKFGKLYLLIFKKCVFSPLIVSFPEAY